MLACAIRPARSWSTSAASASRPRPGSRAVGALQAELARTAHLGRQAAERGVDGGQPAEAVVGVAGVLRPGGAAAPRMRIALRRRRSASRTARLTTRPVESCSCTVARRARPACSEPTEPLASMLWVTARGGHQQQPGAVDERVEHGVDDGHHPRRGLVGALGGEHGDHLLVEVDPGELLAGRVDLGGQQALGGGEALARGDLGAEAGDQALVVALGRARSASRSAVDPSTHPAGDARGGDLVGGR